MPGLTPADIDALFAPLAGCRRLGLAVSGGPDSLALMLIATRWARGQGTALHIYTVDHGLRPEAATEAAMVVREAAALGLPAHILRWTGDKPGTGIQAAARTARYRLLAEAMAGDGVDLLATAHHLGDQAETILMRLAHGSGIEGLRGMDRFSRVEGCEVVRPLLGVRPEVLRDIVSEAGLSAVSDPSNADTHYERVRWRLMLPALEALGLTLERLGTFGRRMDEAGALIEAEAERAYPQIVETMASASVRLDAPRFATLNAAVATVVLARVLVAVAGDRRAPPLGAVEGLARRLQQPEPLKGLTLHGCLVMRDGDSILIRREAPRSAARKTGEALTPS